MTTITAPSKARSVRYDASTRTLVITVAGKATGYLVEEYEAVSGGRGFGLTKIAQKAERYDVLLAPGEHSCTCGDATYRGQQCKHHAALSALIRNGKI